MLLSLFIGVFIGSLLGILFSQRQSIIKLNAAKQEIVRLTATLETERKHHEVQRQVEEKSKAEERAVRLQEIQSLKNNLKEMAAELAITQGATLRAQHAEGLDTLLRPLGNSIEQFKAEFLRQTAATEAHIKDLSEQSHTLGKEAEALAKALRGNTKMQGNWGEQILERLLETSGLTAGRDYEVQVATLTPEGVKIIPDVIVHLPEGRDIVIDSKVSLTAFSSLALTDDAERIATLKKEHLTSVRKHIDELSAKRYTQQLPQAVGYVLMFIPHEAAYLTALEEDPDLLSKAYRKQVILINPSNLFMALQLAYHLWQAERQSQSVADIYLSADKLYRKFANFAANFTKIGRGISSLQTAYEDSYKQLSTGNDNILRQLENWKQKGFTPTKELPDSFALPAEE